MTTEDIQAQKAQMLRLWAVYTSKHMQKSLVRKGVGKTFHLMRSIAHQLIQSGGDTASIRHMFDLSGRFVDMGVGRGQKIGDVKGNADVRALIRAGRRPKKWLSKLYYSEVMSLQQLLADKYAQNASLLVKNTIEK